MCGALIGELSQLQMQHLWGTGATCHTRGDSSADQISLWRGRRLTIDRFSGLLSDSLSRPQHSKCNWGRENRDTPAKSGTETTKRYRSPSKKRIGGPRKGQVLAGSVTEHHSRDEGKDHTIAAILAPEGAGYSLMNSWEKESRERTPVVRVM